VRLTDFDDGFGKNHVIFNEPDPQDVSCTWKDYER
jgi:hypothetical protein